MSGASRSVCACGGALIAAVAAANSVAAQGRATMWTDVVGNGTSVYLTWNKRHPWDALLAGGTDLVATYPGDDARMLSESLARGELSAERSLRFALPAALRSNPSGPVCLSFRVSNGRPLPVREADDAVGDTVGFRYAPWEEPMRQRTEVRVAERRLREAEAAVAIARQNAEQQRAVLRERGWRDLASCDAVTAPVRDTRERPYDVVDASDHDRVARLVCVRRVARARSLFFAIAEGTSRELAAIPSGERARQREQSRDALAEPFVLAAFAPETASMFEDLVAKRGADDAFVRSRRSQAQVFARDWSALSSDIADYRPQLGDESDYLAWSSTAADAAFNTFGPIVAERFGAGWVTAGMAPPDDAVQAAFIGAALGAYFGCLEDSMKQLAIKLETWQREVEAAPAFAVAERDFMVRECRSGVELADKLEGELASWDAELVAANALAQSVAGRALPPDGVVARNQELNFAFCSSP